MFSFQKLLSKDEKLFSLLELSAQEANKSIQALNQILSRPEQVPSLSDFHRTKEADKEITAQINQAVVNDFVTDIDREDIELLSSVLYKIPKTVEKIAERFIISSAVVRGTDFSPHTAILQVATKQVVEMVKQLRLRPNVEQIKEMNDVLQRVESEADQLILDILSDLYSGRHHPTKVLVMKDLYELLEKVVDRCRDAGNAVTHIVIKHS
jgi:uncharacterized protein Yka (UPF0111/DUF47 family)